jgi:hypothetical protein
MEPLLEHLQHCKRCLKRAQSVSSKDSLVALLGKSPTITADLDDPVLQHLMERLVRLAERRGA